MTLSLVCLLILTAVTLGDHAVPLWRKLRKRS